MARQHRLGAETIAGATGDLYHGILNVDKPGGLTSHDVVARLRRATGQRTIGHAGTLDPAATGVLLVCLGHATRVSEYLMAGEKIYRARVRLGVTTDTDDRVGQVLEQRPLPALDAMQLQAALDRFTGQIDQAPPAYSAVKLAGQPAYRRARRGEAVEPAARQVRIEQALLEEWQPPDLTVRVVCSPGTYIRSLARDLGRALGCGAHLAGLVRLGSGAFTVEQATPLADLESAALSGRLESHLYPLQAALSALQCVPVTEDEAARLAHGLPLPCPTPPGRPLGYAESSDRRVIAILAYDSDAARWRPQKVFLAG